MGARALPAAPQGTDRRRDAAPRGAAGTFPRWPEEAGLVGTQGARGPRPEEADRRAEGDAAPRTPSRC